MFDISSLIGDQINNLRPAAQGIVEECRDFGASALQCLERIVDAVEQAPFEEQRVYVEGSTSPLAVNQPLGKAAGGDPLTVPTGEEWLIESVTLNAANGSIAVKILGWPPADQTAAATNQGVGYYPPRALLWGDLTVSGMVTKGGNGVIVQGNTPLYIFTSGAVDYKVQFKRRRLSITKPTTAGGAANPQPDGQTIEQTEVNRHTGTWLPNG